MKRLLLLLLASMLAASVAIALPTAAKIKSDSATTMFDGHVKLTATLPVATMMVTDAVFKEALVTDRTIRFAAATYKDARLSTPDIGKIQRATMLATLSTTSTAAGMRMDTSIATATHKKLDCKANDKAWADNVVSAAAATKIDARTTKATVTDHSIHLAADMFGTEGMIKDETCIGHTALK